MRKERGADPLGLGLDLGTSGVRGAVLDRTGQLLAEAAVALPPSAPCDGRPAQSPAAWWSATEACLLATLAALRAAGGAPARVGAIAVDGTSGTLLACDANLQALSPGLMYDSGGFDEQAALIAERAPGGFSAGPASALARALFLYRSLDPAATGRLLHQADWIAARLRGGGHLSDHNNALKLGADPIDGRWPAWYGELGLPPTALPRVLAPGALTGALAPALARRAGLPDDCQVVAGTTDSVAAWLAADAGEPGDAVTALGTTLAVKVLSPVRVEAPTCGCYSHRLLGHWLAGGAANAGAGVLRELFSAAQITALSAQLRPDEPTALDYYPLRALGERFPVADPHKRPRLTPRPADDRVYFQGILESLARIERDAYRALTRLGAPAPKRVLSTGGGAGNFAWSRIRARTLGVPVCAAQHTEAAVGSARLALRGIAARGR